ncbi:hypothetical protein LTR36_003051 [Oleoguttula mirabilis]|uniref:Uncharacterized protein n=1 Tax=Oleoguttula mirabilis TaxID=1507867 RepID=A0AAV9JXK0_9PEZI|nr:hypothetical protein LTR36_003051 [Oleoguttula mirabilis]
MPMGPAMVYYARHDVILHPNFIFLELGLLDHLPQHEAFKQLILKFVQDEAKKAGIRSARISAEGIAILAEGFMETYEQRLWPRELDNPGRQHLNNPHAPVSPNHPFSGHVRYTIEGRYPAARPETQVWRIVIGEEVTQRNLRGLSLLASMLQKLMESAKQVESTQIALTQEELLACVLAGQGLGRDGLRSWRAGRSTVPEREAKEEANEEANEEEKAKEEEAKDEEVKNEEVKKENLKEEDLKLDRRDSGEPQAAVF